MTLKEKLRWAGIVAIGVVLALFVAFNFDRVPINIIVGKVELPKALIILLSFGLGAGGMWLWMVLRPKFRWGER
jgi:uncharacterized integral membrane protein